MRAINALKSQIKFWTTLPLSVPGRVAISKMVMLPRFLYYFNNLPISMSPTLFQTLDTMLIELI